MYLVTMIDPLNRKIIGWKISTRTDQALVNDALVNDALVNDALAAALATRCKPSGLILQTGRGSQYCSESFMALVKKYGVLSSVSRKGNCWNNAAAESFFATFKKRTIFGKPIATRNGQRQQVFDFIEIYYNRVCRHSTNGWVTPVEFERLITKTWRQALSINLTRSKFKTRRDVTTEPLTCRWLRIDCSDLEFEG